MEGRAAFQSIAGLVSIIREEGDRKGTEKFTPRVTSIGGNAKAGNQDWPRESEGEMSKARTGVAGECAPYVGMMDNTINAHFYSRNINVIDREGAFISGLAHYSLNRKTFSAAEALQAAFCLALDGTPDRRYFEIHASDIPTPPADFALSKLELPLDMFELRPASEIAIPDGPLPMPAIMVVKMTKDNQQYFAAMLSHIHERLGFACFDPLPPVSENAVLFFFANPLTGNHDLAGADLIADLGKSVDAIMQPFANDVPEQDHRFKCDVLRFALQAIQMLNATSCAGGSHD
jgi:hypothetical protein